MKNMLLILIWIKYEEKVEVDKSKLMEYDKFYKEQFFKNEFFSLDYDNEHDKEDKDNQKRS